MRQKSQLLDEEHPDHALQDGCRTKAPVVLVPEKKCDNNHLLDSMGVVVPSWRVVVLRSFFLPRSGLPRTHSSCWALDISYSGLERCHLVRSSAGLSSNSTLRVAIIGSATCKPFRA